MDDRGLVEAILAGELDAPRRLIESYQAGMSLCLCFRMLNHRQDAEDVAAGDLPPGPAQHLHGFDRDLPAPALAARDRREPVPDQSLGQRGKRAFSGRGGRRSAADPRAGPADADDLAAELELAWAASVLNIGCLRPVPRAEPGVRGHRRGVGARSGPSRRGSTGPGPNSPTHLSRRGVTC